MYLELLGLHGKDLDKKLHSISTQEVVMNLNGNELYNRSAIDLQTIFGALPPKLRKLDLSNNDISQAIINELIHALTFLPSQLKSIELAHNHLGLMGVEKIKKLLAIFSKVTEINLAWNDCGQLANLAEAIKALPPTIKKINFRGNKLDLLSEEALILFLAAMPKQLECIDLQNNHLEFKYKEDTLNNILSHLPPNAKVIIAKHPLHHLSLLTADKTTPITKNIATWPNILVHH